ncbi:HD domain-containing protein [Flavilitoribacter nigricans]|uniref:Guanosine-3',5'-bis(Diphosphate) 3'-pyrophosphohydrolase n=1 Tax=Flavilitoribacter nigricans (strain ATCC 23147 / DSM 23189 / NBRC 102662 / NCIMB 1420 / SS-2) TaxID=1122177 RepID=A0A2D0N8G3_FLAN2|nr:HD domain-containing protein [Flavilitoribacter nigricans]PHN04804.1 guanosine-3',5'-bis(diphosphate) 3'-pyrophosphohydrolase [Flavilitoribacter nigricans DSM 23189 = NBRC 102662]
MSWDIDLIRTAWSIAAKAHDGQKYGGSEPGEQIEYLKHIGGVTLEIMQAMVHHPEADAELALTCAILHDTVEDSEISLSYLFDQFGSSIASGVSALTKNPALQGKEASMLDSLRRIKEQPEEVWMVKMADRIINLSQPPYYWNTEKIKAYRAEAQLIHQHLHSASHYLGQRLQDKIDAYPPGGLPDEE